MGWPSAGWVFNLVVSFSSSKSWNIRGKIFIECFLYINNRIEYNKWSNYMLFLVIFKLTKKFQWTPHTRVGIPNKYPLVLRGESIGDGHLKERGRLLHCIVLRNFVKRTEKIIFSLVFVCFRFTEISYFLNFPSNENLRKQHLSRKCVFLHKYEIFVYDSSA